MIIKNRVPPCPFAAQVGVDGCLGPTCPWHIPDSDIDPETTGCLVTESHRQVLLLCNVLQSINESLPAISANVEALIRDMDTIKKLLTPEQRKVWGEDHRKRSNQNQEGIKW